MKTLIYRALFSILAFNFINSLTGQTSEIQGPYEDAFAKIGGPQYIRVFVNYVQSSGPNQQWTSSVNLPTRTAGIIDRLNAAYNPHDIYFIGLEDPCDVAFQVITESNFTPYHIHENALDIFDRGDDGPAAGYANTTPGPYCEVVGSYPGIPASHSAIVVHEVGHCLGLYHTFAGSDPGPGECVETGALCQNGQPDCYCCGDYVCDTPISPQSITVSSNCEESIDPPGLPEEVFRNYMSYAEPAQCRDRFSPEQVMRMRVHIALASVLQSIHIPDVRYPSSTPSGVSGSIVVESGQLNITSPLQMLPGATIRVKKGAKLRVASTITAYCDEMWQGIVVEGDAFDPDQSLAYRGQVDVVNGGVIEHAKCGIDVQDLSAPNNGTSTGGGIVRLWNNAQIRDNIIGVRFGEYYFQNHSSFAGPTFSITDNYRGGSQQPILLKLDAIKGLSIRLSRFEDMRTDCPLTASRAIGIDSWNAGFRLSLSNHFEQLFRGIRADKLTETNGSLSVSASNFVACQKEMELISSGSFVVIGNDFSVAKPDACSSSFAKGIEIRGMTTGFSVSGNDFYFDGVDLFAETRIGTDCIALEEGMSNTIVKNQYSNLTTGNRASGFNGYEQDGLLYLCNSNKENLGGDFHIINGSIRQTQGEITPQAPNILAAGNIFSGSPTDIWCTIVNDGLEINYYFYEDDPAQDPGTPGDPNNACDVRGFDEFPTTQPNSNCADPEPCFLCPTTEVETWKTRFGQNRQQWHIKTAAFDTITNPVQQAAEAEAIKGLRIAMNRDANRILTQYSLDTLHVQTDSIVRWLGLVYTYPADLRLARHYFFTGAFDLFDTLWGQIPVRYVLDGKRQDEIERLGYVYSALRTHLEQKGALLNALPDDLLGTLRRYTNQCDEAGFLSEVILRRNGVEQSPDCSETQLRSMPEKQTRTVRNGPQNLKVYPNPANDLLRIEYPVSRLEGNVRLFDLQGRLRHTLQLPASGGLLEIPVSDFPHGIYVAQWFCNGQTGYTKVLISH
ncbi:MAG: zinc-dependent metalloprotease [Bacteroidetes bacterium]|nr:zinc-dependent metalloprotease [Bacteroidota bacterium]